MSQFGILCVTICLATGSLALAAGIILEQAIWSCLSTWRFAASLRQSPSFLFALRTLPCTLPMIVVLFAVLPSFLRLEPRETAEKPELWLLALALASVFAIALLVARVLRASILTGRIKREWLRAARPRTVSVAVPVYEVESPDSLVALVGIFRPRVFISKHVWDCLTMKEMEAAIAHEMAHVRALDNLKQLLLNASRLPLFFSSTTQIERSFCCASEISADSRALETRISPLDLAGAIVKVARLRAYPAAPAVGVSHLVPDLNISTLRARVERLEVLVKQEHPGGTAARGSIWTLGAAAVFLVYLAKVGAVLLLTHQLTEMLVR